MSSAGDEPAVEAGDTAAAKGAGDGVRRRTHPDGASAGAGESIGDGAAAAPSSLHNGGATAAAATTTEYMVALEQWLGQAYRWHCVAATFPFALASHFAGATTSAPLGAAAAGHQHPPAYNNNNYYYHQLTMQQNGGPAINRGGFQPPAPHDNAGVEYNIPPLWKRFVAEFLDFAILFVVKLAVTFIAVDYFDIVDIDKYDFDLLHPNVKINYKMALQMTSEIVMLEVVHRLVVCVFETLCLHRGHRGVGGATPGKSLMGIKVVLCDRVTLATQQPNNGGRGGTRVVVSPASDLGLWFAFCRSVIKNFSLAFFVPISFTLFVFQHNRTAYDILCRSIVVEDLAPGT